MTEHARRFVVLKHDHPTLHWDLLLENGDHLRSWRLSGPPQTGETVDAEPSAEHRLMYLEYEGPVSADRGTVTRHAHGPCTIAADSENELALAVLDGTLIGMLRLTRDPSGRWTLTHEPPMQV